ncbi:MAG: 50S ribosome-binding GTPase [Candidatus Fermentibacteraceae bacterium]|nr:50S ribosome-binding GTPase [Candidatus Fermentibacteraceae bacterium]
MPSGIIPSGYALVAGLSNTGKSSLLNALTETSISPVALQPASTRMPITAICTPGNAQICFVDTPPLESGYDWSIIDWVDVVVLVVDIKQFDRDLEKPVVKHFLRRARSKPVVLALGRSDYVHLEHRAAYVSRARCTNRFTDIVPVTPPLNFGIEKLKNAVLQNIPMRNRLFPRNINTLNSKRFLISEQIRTQLFSILPPDVAGETAVQVEETSQRDGRLYVRANLIVSRASSKGMLIGRKGQTLDRINRLSLDAIGEFTGEDCRLDLWVKVREAWTENKTDLLEFGYVC